MALYRKKPVIIVAEQFWPNSPILPDGVYRADRLNGPDDPGYRVMTLEGEVRVSPGDYVITGILGEKYPCRGDIFYKTYEPVGEEDLT